MNPKLYWGFVNSGYHYQDMHNSLQLNNGNNTFSEISWMANVAETDWSWCPLIADFDNDGFKDIFVTNGIKREVFNKDFNNKQGKGLTENPGLFEGAISFLPVKKSFNAMFKNNGDLTFTDSAMDWGLKTQAFNSNGAAYADLDNDGDLDLILNNMEDKAAVYKNNAAEKNNALTLTLTKNGNIAYGARASLLQGEKQQTSQITNTRGFQSVSDHRIHFGIGENTKTDSIVITWPNNKKSVYTNLASNTNHTI
ncbi:MAG: CRTAC1 family protein, partial [Flavobacteriales bacterium]